MTRLLPELARALPADVQLDGELVALEPDGRPDFHRLADRMLHRRPGITVDLFVFDVLAVEGLPTTMLSYLERPALLEQLYLEGPRVRLVAKNRGTARFAEERDGVGRRVRQRLGTRALM